MSRLYCDEHVSLDKEIRPCKNVRRTNHENIKNVYEIERCAKWIREHNFERVCLQFPDHLLPDSVEVCFELQKILDQTIYIMGDTAYESCCLDFIAAEHVSAEAIIHFGSVCFSQSSNSLPYLNIFEKHGLDVENLKQQVEIFLSTRNIFLYVLIDTPYLHKIDQLYDGEIENVKVLPFDKTIDYSAEGYYLYVGNNYRKLENILFSLDGHHLYQYDPVSSNPIVTPFQENNRILKRRFYLSEKIKDGHTFGIVMGTLSVDNYLKVLSRMKKLLKLNKKKYYVLSVGKISVEKLANFPEMDIFVLITCAMNEVYDNREFYKPVVTPFDVEMAFNPSSSGLKFTYDYNTFLDKVISEDNLQPLSGPDVSLLTGELRYKQSENEEKPAEENQIALKPDGALVQSSRFGAGYLANKSWKGLEQNLGETEVELVKEGRKGIAQCYLNEVTKK